jgi:hypothetical protein
MIRLAPLLLLAIPACADEIAPSDPDAGDPVAGGKVQTTVNGDGSYTSVVDSTSMEAWTIADLETGAEVTEDAPWDVSFQRFHLKLNGGVHGDGGVRVAPIADVTLDDLAGPPAQGWITDEADGDDEDTEPDYAFEQGDGWYAYDPATHVLTPRPIVWVLETVEGNVTAIAIEDYYDDLGTAGVFTLRWKPLATGGGS